MECGEVARLGSPPPLDAWEQRIYDGYKDLGRDLNGSPLLTEKWKWLDKSGIDEPDTQAEVFELWRAMESADAELREARSKGGKQ